MIITEGKCLQMSFQPHLAFLWANSTRRPGLHDSACTFKGPITFRTKKNNCYQ